MNNDVSVTKLAALEFSEEMHTCFKKMSEAFFLATKPFIN